MKDGLRSYCRDCQRICNKNYRENHKEKLYEYTRIYNQNYRRKDGFAKRERERWHTRKEYFKKYRKANRDKYIIHYQNRRGRLNGLECLLTLEQWKEIQIKFDNHCAYCGKAEKLTQDHIIPVTKCGKYIYQNIIPACKHCNSSKQNSDYKEWYKNQPFYSYKKYLKILKHMKHQTNPLLAMV